MKKIVLSLLALLSAALSFADTKAEDVMPKVTIVTQAEPLSKEYVMVITSFDWGPGITKLILNVGKNVDETAVFPSDFTVDVSLNKQKDDSNKLGFGIITGQLQVKDAYLCTPSGEPSAESYGRYIALEIAAAPWLADGDPFFHFPQTKSMSNVCGLRIKAKTLDLLISDRTAIVNPLAGLFSVAVFTKGDISLNYAWWFPEAKEEAQTENAPEGANAADSDRDAASANAAETDSIPLIIWFHGLGEDGTNPYKPLFGTKSTNLITPLVQQYFEHGAAVLMPQCPTTWLETTTKDILGNRIWAPADIQSVKGKLTKPIKDFFGKAFSSGTAKDNGPSATVSYYTTATIALINQFLAEHPNIDRKRVYVGGCSAGGYMTLNVCLQAPELFAAAFPTCPAFPDSKITDEQIDELSKLPLWFTQARNDTTVKPETYSMATVARLRNARAANLHYTLWDDVHDLTGTYEEPPENPGEPPTGKPYQFEGHYSWIYTLNNKCVDEGVTLFEWLSKQRQP